METSPKISIIIPTYNREKIIGRTLDCIAAQTFTEWECIVVDDFSADNTRRLIEEYEKKDGRFHYMLNERKKGAQGARNTGIYHARSEWIWLMDSDDTVHVDFLEKMYAATNTDVDVVTCYTNVIDKDSMLVTNTRKWDCCGNIHEDLLAWKSYVYYQSSILRKSKLLEIGGLDENCPAHQEYDTHI
ncbi:MAG: glycosyltransferase family 2 protein, partial [Bacteroidales bacterium]|nr:glycosyltransferase family 2 protein [Bacteroidales bacterium]